MTESLHHRGPDNTGFYNTVIKEKKVFLDHKRLNIIDLSHKGNQPMQSEDGEIIIAYNEEVYNFQELAEAISIIAIHPVHQKLTQVEFYLT